MSQDALNGRKPWPALGLRDMRNREPEAFSELDELNVSTAGQVEMEATRLGVFWKAGRGTHRRCPWHFSRDREPERGGDLRPAEHAEGAGLLCLAAWLRGAKSFPFSAKGLGSCHAECVSCTMCMRAVDLGRNNRRTILFFMANGRMQIWMLRWFRIPRLPRNMLLLISRPDAQTTVSARPPPCRAAGASAGRC